MLRTITTFTDQSARSAPPPPVQASPRRAGTRGSRPRPAGRDAPDELPGVLAVRDFVAPAPATFDLDLPLGEARRLLRESGRDALPVMEDGHPVAVVTAAELDAVPEGDLERTCLRDVIRLRVVYCFADSDVADAAATMRAAEVDHLAVLGEDVRFLGLVARDDLPG